MHVSALPSRAHVSGPAFEGPRGARDAAPCSDGRCGARRRLQAPAPEGIQVRESVVKHLEPAECASPPLWSSGDPHACTPVGSARAWRRNLHGTREEVRVREDWNRSSGPPDRGSPQMRGGGFHCWAGRSEPLFMQMAHRYMWRTVSGDGAVDRPGAALPHCGTARIHTQARLAGAARTRRRLRHRAGQGDPRSGGPEAAVRASSSWISSATVRWGSSERPSKSAACAPCRILRAIGGASRVPEGSTRSRHSGT